VKQHGYDAGRRRRFSPSPLGLDVERCGLPKKGFKRGRRKFFFANEVLCLELSTKIIGRAMHCLRGVRCTGSRCTGMQRAAPWSGPLPVAVFRRGQEQPSQPPFIRGLILQHVAHRVPVIRSFKPQGRRARAAYSRHLARCALTSTTAHFHNQQRAVCAERSLTLASCLPTAEEAVETSVQRTIAPCY
jgi:hypothetical protein